MTHTTEKTFIHKNTGTEFGTVELTFPTKGWEMNGKPIETAGVIATVSTYFMQSFADAYAGVGASKSIEEAQAAFDKKVEAVLTGTVGMRSGGGGVSALHNEMRKIARAALKAQLSADEYKAKYSDAETVDRNKLLDEIVEANESTIKPIAEAELARKAKEAQATAKLAGSIEIK